MRLTQGDNTVTTYKPLPTFVPPDGAHTMPELQAAILKFLLSTGCTATLSDTQLEAAEAAACRACAQSSDLDVIAILSAARHTIAAVLKFRRDHPIDSTVAAATAPARPQGGKAAPLQPAPKINPPAPAYAGVAGSMAGDIAF